MSDDPRNRVARFGVPLPSGLLREFDMMPCEKVDNNRSLAIAGLIRSGLVNHRQYAGNHEIAGTITLAYDQYLSSVQQVLSQLHALAS